MEIFFGVAVVAVKLIMDYFAEKPLTSLARRFRRSPI